MSFHIAKRPASALADGEPHSDRLGGTVGEANKPVSELEQAAQKPFESTGILGGPKRPPATLQKSAIPEARIRKDHLRYYRFEQPNNVTVKMTDGSPLNVEGAFGHDGYRITKPLGYLMRVGSKWIARVGNRRSEPLPFQSAKAAARRMDREHDFGNVVPDPVHALNLAAATAIDAEAKRLECPSNLINLMGGQNIGGGIDPEIVAAILDDEVPDRRTMPPQPEIETYPDGYPKLPACLARARRAR